MGILANGNHLKHLRMSVNPRQRCDSVLLDANNRVCFRPRRAPSPKVPRNEHQFQKVKSFERREQVQRSDGIKRLRVDVNTRVNIGKCL